MYNRQNDDDDKTGDLGGAIINRTKTYYLLSAITATVASLCIISVIIALRKRIKLVVQLFVEAGKSITAMPLLLFEPILV